MNATIALRAATPEDEEFLYRVYAGTRAEELARTGWDEKQKESFLRMQFAAQHAYYHDQWPDAQFDLVFSGDSPVGRLYVHRRRDEIRVIDIALLPEYRGNGVGTALLLELMDEARTAGKPIQIHVEKHNPALELYRRLGFVETGDTGVYYLMKWAGEPASPADGGES